MHRRGRQGDQVESTWKIIHSQHHVWVNEIDQSQKGMKIFQGDKLE